MVLPTILQKPTVLHKVGRRASKESGMSLMEVMVAMALIAGVMALSMPYVSSMMGVQVREESRHLAQTTRYLFDRAAITGNTYRVAFNLDRHAYWVELNDSEEGVLVYQSAEAKEEGEENQAELIEANQDPEDQSALFDQTAASAYARAPP